jgi:hypothetical protein
MFCVLFLFMVDMGKSTDDVTAFAWISCSHLHIEKELDASRTIATSS